MARARKMRKPTLATIKARLRKGLRPATWIDAKEIGEGAFCVAYRVGDYVVKKRGSLISHASYKGFARTKRALARLGIGIPPMRKVGPWVIQPYCRHVSSRFKLTSAMRDDCEEDVHINNLGYYNGQLVAFDW